MSDDKKYSYADVLRDEREFFREFERRVALPVARAMFQALDKAWSASADHDAVPEAKATTTPLNEGAACNTATSGTGDTRESLPGSLPGYLGDGVSPSHNEKNLRHTQRPVAWARFYPNGGPQSVYLDRPPADAEPLYRSPTLTDAEREAIKEGADALYGDGYDAEAAALRLLLERLN